MGMKGKLSLEQTNSIILSSLFELQMVSTTNCIMLKRLLADSSVDPDAIDDEIAEVMERVEAGLQAHYTKYGLEVEGLEDRLRHDIGLDDDDKEEA